MFAAPASGASGSPVASYDTIGVTIAGPGSDTFRQNLLLISGIVRQTLLKAERIGSVAPTPG